MGSPYGQRRLDDIDTEALSMAALPGHWIGMVRRHIAGSTILVRHWACLGQKNVVPAMFDKHTVPGVCALSLFFMMTSPESQPQAPLIGIPDQIWPLSDPHTLGLNATLAVAAVSRP
jgi:hypothetical protein